MELRTLRYFVAVADAGSVTAAAFRLHVAQPSLSRQVAGLERQLGVLLFDRAVGRLRLSPAGRQLLPLARDLLARADGFTSAANTLGKGGLRELRVAAPATTVSDVVAPFIATFGADDPVPVVATLSNSSPLELLLSGAADIVLSPRTPEPELAHRLVAMFPIWLYVRPDDPRANTDRVQLEHLTPSRLLLLPSSFVQREVIETAATRSGTSLTAAREVTSPEIAQALCAAGWGDAVVSDDSRFGLQGLLIAAGGEILTMPVYAAWNREHVGAAQLAHLVDRLATFCADRYGDPAAISPAGRARRTRRAPIRR